MAAVAGHPSGVAAMLAVVVCVLLATLPGATCSQAATNVTIGGLFPFSPSSRTNAGLQRSKAAHLALESVNDDGAMLPGMFISLLDRDTGANSKTGVTSMFDLISEDGVPIVVGAASSSVSMAATQIGDIFSVPLISYSSTSASLSNKQLYPYFSRTVPVDSAQAGAIVALIRSAGWTQFSVISAASSYAAGLIDDISTAAALASVTVDRRAEHPALTSVPDTTTYINEIDAGLRAIKAGTARVIVMSNLEGDATDVLWRARLLGMVGADTAWTWVGTDGWLQSPTLPASSLCDAACAALNQAAIAGVIGTQPFTNQAALSSWQTNVWNPNVDAAHLTASQKALTNLTTWANGNMNAFAPFAYDAAYAAAAAIHALCFAPTVGGMAPVANGTDCLARLAVNGSHLLEEVRKVDFQGATGRVLLNDAGDRPSDYDILNVDAAGTRHIVGLWEAASDTVNITTGGCSGGIATCAAIYWRGGGPVPSDSERPVCGVGEELSISTTGEAFCVTCARDTYNLEVNSTCKECPIGAVCNGGAELAADGGYWQLQVGLPAEPIASRIDYSTLTYEPVFLRCRAAPYACCPDGDCTVNATAGVEPPVCATRRSGVLCSWCEDGYTLWAGECLPCEGINGGMFVLGILFTIALLIFLIVRPPSKSASSIIVIDYYQLSNIIAVPSNNAGSSVFSYMTLLFNLNPNEVGSVCPAELSPLEGATLGYMMPVVLLAELLLMYTGVLVYAAWRRKKSRKKALTTDAATMAGAGASSKRETRSGRQSIFAAASDGEKLVPGSRQASSGSLALDDDMRGGSFRRLTTAPRMVTNGAASSTGSRGKRDSGAASAAGGTRKRALSKSESVMARRRRELKKKLHGGRMQALPIEERFYVAFWRVVFFVYAGLTVTALTLLNCRNVGDQYHVLESFPNVECWDSSHIIVGAMSVPVLVLVTAGVPGWIIMRYRLLRHRRRSTLRRLVIAGRRARQEAAQARGDTMGTLADEGKVVKLASKFVKRILPPRGYMRDSRMYRAGVRGWFPAAFFLRRATMSVIAVYLAQDPVWRQIALFVCCLGLLTIQLWYRPFMSRADDGVAVVAMVALLLESGAQLYVATVATSQELSRLHVESGRDVFVLTMDVLLLSLPLIYLLYINGGKIKRSIAKRRQAGFLCIKPKKSRAQMAAERAAARTGHDDGVELGTIREYGRAYKGGARSRSKSKAQRRKGTTTRRVDRENPLNAFTDMTPDQL